MPHDGACVATINSTDGDACCAIVDSHAISLSQMQRAADFTCAVHVSFAGRPFPGGLGVGRCGGLDELRQAVLSLVRVSVEAK